MKFKLKPSIITIKPCLNSHEMFEVTRGCYFIEEGTVMSLVSIKENLEPAGCDSLDLVDPGMNERICEDGG